MSVQSLGQKDPPTGRNGNPLQYSCLENPMDRGILSMGFYNPWGHKKSDTTGYACMHGPNTAPGSETIVMNKLLTMCY